MMFHAKALITHEVGPTRLQPILIIIIFKITLNLATPKKKMLSLMILPTYYNDDCNNVKQTSSMVQHSGEP